ncbi:MAG: ATPase [Rhizobiaceae bacterium]|nr:ATPase [Rhizobiaceae bacterium]
MSDVRLARPELPKRFYLDVTVVKAEAGGFTTKLDGRGVKTPLRRPLVVPTLPLAERLASEWAAQAERIDPATMALTRFANTVIDGVADDPGAVRKDLAGYVETDMLFYRATYPERLIERQHAIWDPIVAWIEGELGVRFVRAEGVMHVVQAPEAVAAFRARIDAVVDPFAVAALHQMTTLMGSAILALAVADRRLGVDEAWEAAHLEEDWNVAQWGMDAEAAARRTARLADMRIAAEFLDALR